MSGAVSQYSQIILCSVQGPLHVHKVRGIIILTLWIEINIHLYLVLSAFYVVLFSVRFACKEIS
jgi:hypothetical protein